ncbi:acetyl-CoA carboxylase biotin carboxyl carrier protein [Azorhizobium sp. AG788]|uniref:acetyl-CoA carboxylase biotin carboxyl carrier protein n=1 Tax=Azorhizobium sp. AG788 TaxID=2183897 RepID=UPI0010621D7E|nr:biotin/lipoyl-containing protein [Azorhizobium sp. AG788]TDU00873.1 acetyl-CoA carboxylase biotin carboxyl carrier protein [Azorhizobium sp. AG788]
MKMRTPQLSISLVRELASLLSGSDLSEIEVQNDEIRIRVARTADAPPVGAGQPRRLPPPMADLSATRGAGSTKDLVQGRGALFSPTVGTAYRGSVPDALPFVEVGTAVVEGQTVLIVETMKTLNAIAAHRSGTVTRVLVENGQPVEYGELLLVIE